MTMCQTLKCGGEMNWRFFSDGSLLQNDFDINPQKYLTHSNLCEFILECWNDRKETVAVAAVRETQQHN